MAKTRLPPVVRITWDDAHELADASVGYALQDALDAAHGPLVTTSCGYLLRSDDDGVTIATDVQEQGEAPTFRGVMFIPRGMVRVEAGGARKPRKPRAAKVVPS